MVKIADTNTGAIVQVGVVKDVDAVTFGNGIFKIDTCL